MQRLEGITGEGSSRTCGKRLLIEIEQSVIDMTEKELLIEITDLWRNFYDEHNYKRIQIYYSSDDDIIWLLLLYGASKAG